MGNSNEHTLPVAPCARIERAPPTHNTWVELGGRGVDGMPNVVSEGGRFATVGSNIRSSVAVVLPRSFLGRGGVGNWGRGIDGIPENVF